MYVLPDELRDELKEPLGLLVDTKNLLDYISDKSYIVVIGDFVTFTLFDNGIRPDLCIVDFIVKRKECSDDIKKKIADNTYDVIRVKNLPGTISDELWTAIEFVFKHRKKNVFRIEVNGEEDLAALAVIYLAPSDATVIYGLPNKGAVIAEATKTNKQKVKDILDKM